MKALTASLDFFEMLDPTAALVLMVSGSILGLLIIIGAACFPWWIRRIMIDVREVKKILTDINKIRGLMEVEIEARAVRLRLEDEMRHAQLRQLQDLNARLADADIVREPGSAT